MKHKVSIKLRDNSMPFFEIDKDKFQVKPSKNEDIFIEADKVELLNVGSGVLSMICGSINICYPLDLIKLYWIDDVREEA